MNKTSKLFCAAILLLSVTCKDAPMTEPSPYANLEYVYQTCGKKRLTGLQDSTGRPVVPIQYDSIRPGFDERFLIGWRNGQRMLIQLAYSKTDILFGVKFFILSSNVEKEGNYLYYEVQSYFENSERKKIILADKSKIYFWSR